MRAVITAGGTAGHINPALAIAGEIMKNEPGSDILFIGRKDGMERKLVAESGYRLAEVEVHGFMRRISLSNIWFNLKSVFHVFSAQNEAKKLIREFSPDVVIGCGGYVSGPVVRAATKLGIKTAIQEQNAFPGITTKLLAKRVDLILCADEDGLKRIGYPNKSVVTGNPIRHAFFEADRNSLRDRWNVGDKIFVLSYGGSNGAAEINRVAAAFMQRHWKTGKVFHVHATGEYTKDSFPGLLMEYGIDLDRCDNIKVFEYISDMPEYYAASDLILSRAGALTIGEIAASGRASVLIPSPNVTENHQFYNAMSLANAGAAFVYEEKDLDVDALANRLMELVETPKYLREMGEHAREKAIEDSANQIYFKICALIEKG